MKLFYVLVAIVAVVAAFFLGGGSDVLDNFPVALLWAKQEFFHKDIPDLSGKVAIVTGGNTGLGKSSVAAMYAHNAHVILCSRSVEKGEAAAKSIRATYPSSKGKIDVMALDLESLASVRAFAKKFRETKLRLDILMLNAGIMFIPFAKTKEGIEKQFGVNHVAHFLLTQELLDILKASAPSRVVVLSSSGHQFAPSYGVATTLAGINDEGKYGQWSSYGQSKLANILFGRELARRVEKDGIYVNMVHPGGVKTELQRNVYSQVPEVVANTISYIMGLSSYHPDHASLTQLYAAVSPEIVEKRISGQYFVPIARRKNYLHSKAEDDQLASALWKFTEELVKPSAK